MARKLARRQLASGSLLAATALAVPPKLTPGAFSVSLAVKDIAASKLFYEQLGFTVTGGNQAKNWLVLRNGDPVIGLFQGTLEKNIRTVNPG